MVPNQIINNGLDEIGATFIQELPELGSCL